ncbi:MAG: metallophosphoesterase family protein [Lentisphaeria bacterium]|nr:metallophosphoesterase family protein [Lentisphaeria bacterium]
MRDQPSQPAIVKTPAAVVSDVHLGSPHCRQGEFLRFLDSFHEPVTLVFAGDTVDRPESSWLKPSDQSVLDRLASHPLITPVFIRGNHDETCSWFERNMFPMVSEVRIPAVGMLVCHGDDFQIVRGHHRLFVFLFNGLHRMRIRLGAPPVHVAEYAKHWSLFYRALRRIVRENAADYALQEGAKAIACGHVHFAEDTMVKGIRYVNTGCWTEPDPHYLMIRDGVVELKVWERE